MAQEEKAIENSASLQKNFYVQWDAVSISEGDKTFTVTFPAYRRAIAKRTEESESSVEE